MSAESNRSKRIGKAQPAEDSPKPSLPSKDNNFRENPERCVCVFGEINAGLVRNLTPHILKLRKESCTQPITVYIDSPGGSIESYEHLEGLLFHANQDGDRCRIITVATSFAASAAARLLAKGDYSMAYQNATIHCHGTRYEGGVVTRERAESMAESLALFNDDMANDFVHKIIESLTWLYRFNLDAVEIEKPASDADQFKPMYRLSQLIKSKLSYSTKKLYESVLDEVSKVGQVEAFLAAPSRAKQLGGNETLGQSHRDIKLLKLIAEYVERQMQGDEKKEGLSKARVNQIMTLYSVRRSYYERFIKDCEDPEPLLMMFCDKDALNELAAITKEEDRRMFLLNKCGVYLFAAWQLATTVAAGLVKGENSLTALDAYWIGLIEEVVGCKNVRSRREFHELCASQAS